MISHIITIAAITHAVTASEWSYCMSPEGRSIPVGSATTINNRQVLCQCMQPILSPPGPYPQTSLKADPCTCNPVITKCTMSHNKTLPVGCTATSGHTYIQCLCSRAEFIPWNTTDTTLHTEETSTNCCNHDSQGRCCQCSPSSNRAYRSPRCGIGAICTCETHRP